MGARNSGRAKVFKHADALYVIAREAGYPSWPRLTFAAEMQAMDRAARAERLKSALYLGQVWIVVEALKTDNERVQQDDKFPRTGVLSLLSRAKYFGRHPVFALPQHAAPQC